MSRGVIITQALLQAVFTGFKANFARGFGNYTSQWDRIATRVPSSTREEKYGWIGRLTSMREWIGDRVFNSLTTSDYAIKNRKFEGSYELDRDDVSDDQIGILAPFLEDLGQTGAELPDRIVFDALRAGRTTACFDNQPFFDTSHPGFDATGAAATYSNYQAGTGEPWYLMVTKRPLKPLIFQEREKVELQVLTDLKSATVMLQDKFLYGNRGRMNAGYGFPQMAFCSRQPLTAENYEAAFKAIQTQFSEGGRSLNLTPDLLVHGPQNRGAAKRLIERSQVGGSDNEFYKDVDLMTSPLVTA
jgi:phage major head subunit gpT-like protein